MLKAIIAGRLGRDAEHRTTQGGTDICSFSVACDVGYGENKTTVWVDVAKFGAGASGLARILSKGDSVTVVGDLKTREHNGKTYLDCRADEIALQGGQGGERTKPQSDRQAGEQGGSNYDDLDDEIPPF